MSERKKKQAKHATKKPSNIEPFTETAFKALDKVKTTLETRLCEDQYVGLVNQLSSDADDFYQRLPVNERPASLKCVIIVLESPHTEEFPHNDEPGVTTPNGNLRTLRNS